MSGKAKPTNGNAEVDEEGLKLQLNQIEEAKMKKFQDAINEVCQEHGYTLSAAVSIGVAPDGQLHAQGTVTANKVQE